MSFFPDKLHLNDDPTERIGTVLAKANTALLESICEVIPDSKWQRRLRLIKEKEEDDDRDSRMQANIIVNEDIIAAAESNPQVLQAIKNAQVNGVVDLRQFAQDLLTEVGCAEAEAYAGKTLPKILAMAQASPIHRLTSGK